MAVITFEIVLAMQKILKVDAVLQNISFFREVRIP